MKQDKDLLLKDLSARLPYGVILERADLVREELRTMTKEGLINDDYNIEKVKPYLFPISSMTEEQLGELIELVWPNTSYDIYLDLDEPEVDINIGNRSESYLVSEIQYWGIKAVSWLYKNHFDVNDLIPLGLAKDATDLGIY